MNGPDWRVSLRFSLVEVWKVRLHHQVDVER